MAVRGIGTTLYQWDMDYQGRGLSFDEHLSEGLGEIASAGFDGVQARLRYANTPAKARELAGLLGHYGLSLASLYGQCKLYDRADQDREIAEFTEAAAASTLAGCSLIVLDMAYPPGRDKTEVELGVQAEGVERIGEALSSKNMRLAIHNHTPEMRHNGREFHYMMQNVTSPAVGACLDVAWCIMAGVSPTELIRDYHQRIFDLHVRNFAEGQFTQAVPEGVISYAEILNLLLRYGYDGWLVVELAYDNLIAESAARDRVELTRPFRENITRSLWYLKGLAAGTEGGCRG